MGFRMMLLIIVDKIRSSLLKSLTDYDNKIKVDSKIDSSNMFDSDSYIDDKTVVITAVDQKLLATMVVFTCIMTRSQCSTAQLDQPIVEVFAGADKNNIMFEGTMTLNNLLEMAEQAEVDHVVDFLLRENVTLNRHQ